MGRTANSCPQVAGDGSTIDALAASHIRRHAPRVMGGGAAITGSGHVPWDMPEVPAEQGVTCHQTAERSTKRTGSRATRHVSSELGTAVESAELDQSGQTLIDDVLLAGVTFKNLKYFDFETLLYKRE